MAIKDWPGGTITDIPVEPSGNYEDSAASGVWTVDQVSNYVKQDRWPTPGNIDPSKYVEGVFSTYLYEGNGTSQSIDNGIDLSGEGGLVWIKSRPDTYGHRLIDTERGVLKVLESYDTTAEATQAGSLTAFNSNGFSVGNAGHTNFSGNSFASWTFRKAEKFFDVVTYTGDGVAGRTVAHNLGSVPACIIVKKTSNVADWQVYHVGVDATAPQDYFLSLNLTDARGDSTVRWNDTAPTDSVFTLGSNSLVNQSGQTYVAYLFASDAGGFGNDGSENIIKCGSYTGTGVAGIEVDLGFEPQWIMFRRTDGTGDWLIYDVMRGIVTGGSDERLEPNTSDAAASSVSCEVTATGFTVTSNGTYMNASGGNYIYIAIRRPMKTPESGTEVFATAQRDTTAPIFEGGFPVDAAIIADVSGAWINSPSMGSRLTGTSRLATSNTNAQGADGLFMWDYMNGWGDGSGSYPEFYSWMFKRATGFFDVVAYTGDGVATQTLNHNLGVTPDIIVVKKRSTSGSQWPIIITPTTDTMYLNTTHASFGAFYYIDNPTSTTFDVQTDGSSPQSNQSGETYTAYLFATLAGVSKVGSYTGTAADLNVDCGFSAGARFILIKRTDSTGDWYVWDSVRGIVAGNDPYLLLNSSAAQVTSTDYIDPLSSGFTVTSSAPAALNASGGTYIFLAIA